MQKLKKVPANWKTSDDSLKRLAYLVNKQMSGLLIESAENICTCGASSGFAGFCYYTETCKFFDTNEDEINDLLIDTAEQIGYNNILQLLASFNGAKDVGSIDQLKNLCAWFAMEEAARFLCDNYKLITE